MNSTAEEDAAAFLYEADGDIDIALGMAARAVLIFRRCDAKKEARATRVHAILLKQADRSDEE